jgi:hypothetical protein
MQQQTAFGSVLGLAVKLGFFPYEPEKMNLLDRESKWREIKSGLKISILHSLIRERFGEDENLYHFRERHNNIRGFLEIEQINGMKGYAFFQPTQFRPDYEGSMLEAQRTYKESGKAVFGSFADNIRGLAGFYWNNVLARFSRYPEPDIPFTDEDFELLAALSGQSSSGGRR